MTSGLSEEFEGETHGLRESFVPNMTSSETDGKTKASGRRRHKHEGVFFTSNFVSCFEIDPY